VAKLASAIKAQFADSIRYPAVALGVFFALCVANRPRFWWQELFCSFAIWWLPLACLAFCYLLQIIVRRASRSFLFLWLGVLAHGYAISFMGLKALPYVYYNSWSAVDLENDRRVTGLWIDDWNQERNTSDLERLIHQHRADLLMIAGRNLEVVRYKFRDLSFPHSACVDSVDEKSICVASIFAISLQGISNLGVNALPGGVFAISLGGGVEFQLGVINLERSLSRDIFERIRVTARRLSSIMRDSDGLRIVAGQFSASPFSQLVSVYSEQARMSSLMFGKSKLSSTGWAGPSIANAGRNVFVSKGLAPIKLSSFKASAGIGEALWFEVAIGQPIASPYKK
jgi:hypothetical protein